jgi:RNA polymerase sigma factor (sigma-70 family)
MNREQVQTNWNVDGLLTLVQTIHEPPSNQELLEEAFNDGAFRRRVMSMCAAVMDRCGIHDPDELEDYTQRLMLKLWEVCRRGKSIKQISNSYLFKMALNLVRDDLRRLRNRVNVLSLDDMEAPWLMNLPDSALSPEVSLIEREPYEQLLQAMQCLQPREAEIVRRRSDGESYEQIAGEMGLSAQNARQIFCRAKKLLAEQVCLVE